MSERKSNKYCVVPECRNNSINAPDKLFISVPRDPATRKVWQQAMNRDVGSEKSHVHCCEDHFNIEEDVENYMYIKLMKRGNIRLKPKVVPRFFDCQKNRITTERSKPPSMFLQKKEEQYLNNTLVLRETSEISLEYEDVEQKHETKIEPKFKDMGVQVLFKAAVHNKGTQCTSDDLTLSKFGKNRKCPSKKRLRKETRFTGSSTDSISSSGSTSIFRSSEENLSLSDNQ